MAPTRAARSWFQLSLQVLLLVTGLGLLQVVAERTSHRFDLTPGNGLSLSPVRRGAGLWSFLLLGGIGYRSDCQFGDGGERSKRRQDMLWAVVRP